MNRVLGMNSNAPLPAVYNKKLTEHSQQGLLNPSVWELLERSRDVLSSSWWHYQPPTCLRTAPLSSLPSFPEMFPHAGPRLSTMEE